MRNSQVQRGISFALHAITRHSGWPGIVHAIVVGVRAGCNGVRLTRSQEEKDAQREPFLCMSTDQQIKRLTSVPISARPLSARTVIVVRKAANSTRTIIGPVKRVLCRLRTV